MTALFIVMLLAATAAFVSTPFWVKRGTLAVEDPRIAALEAAREAKYREIRDAQLDHAAGKLGDADFEQIDAELRRDAVEILDRLERARGGAGSA